MSDLIKGCRKGNKKSQEEFYSRFYGVMFPICLRYVGNKEEAREVLNDAFLKALTFIHTYSGKGSLEAWVRRIVVNKCLDYLRHISKYRSTILLTEQDDYRHGRVGDFEYEVEHHYLSWLLNELTPIQRGVFNLFALEGYSHEEIGKTLGISVSNSKYLLHQARKVLKDRIKKNETDERSTGS